MEGMQTCLRGRGEKCLPKSLETQPASLENTLIPVKRDLKATRVHTRATEYIWLTKDFSFIRQFIAERHGW